MDAELSNGEMQAIKNHLNDCGKCRREYETLQETKSLVASLAIRAPRAELNELLESSLQQSAPPSLTDRVSWWWEENVANREGLRVRPHTMAATALFSFAGLWLATVSLDGPHDWHRRTPTPDYRLTPGVAVFGIRISSHGVSVFSGRAVRVPAGVDLPFPVNPRTAYGMDSGAEYITPHSLTPVTVSAFGPMAPPTAVWHSSVSPTALISAERRVTPY